METFRRGSKRQCRFETNRVARPEKLCSSRILTTLKEGVKGSEIRTRAVPVAARNVEVNLDARIPLTSESARGFDHTLPVAASVFPREIFRAPKRWAEQTYSNLIHWNELDRGGHFAAFEEPDLFVQELRAAFTSLREGR
jgi:hypothetical protein